MSTPLLALCAFLLVFVVAPYLQYTWPIYVPYILVISLSRSSGATFLFKLGSLWMVVRLGYFTNGLFRTNYDSNFLIRLC